VIYLFAGGLRSQDQIRVSDDPIAAAQKIPLAPPVRAGVTVTVVDPAGRPIAGVSLVAVLGIEKVDKRRLWEVQMAAAKKFPDDVERMQIAIFQQLGVRFVTDDTGQATVPALGSRDAILVVSGAMRLLIKGSREFGKKAIRVTLRPTRVVHVQVVDQKGRPVRGMRVGVIPRGVGGGEWSARPLTDARGIARVPPGQLLETGTRRFLARADIACTKPVQQEFDPHGVHDAEHPVRITLPPYGQIRLFLVDKNQRPIRGIEDAQLTLRGGDRRRVRAYSADLVGGDAAMFKFVAVGERVRLYCKHDGGPDLTMNSEGPRHHMDTRIVTLQVPGRTRFLWRLSGVDGRPVVSEEVGLVFAMGSRMIGRTVTTDEAGVMKVVIPGSGSTPANGAAYVVRRFDGSTAKMKFLGAKKIALAELVQSPGEPVDLRLESEKLVTAGRVVDTEGKPIEGVVLTAKNIYGSFGKERLEGRVEFFTCTAVTDASGRFQLRAATVEFLPPKLTLHKPGYRLTSGADLVGGRNGVKLTMTATTTIEGRVLGLPPHGSLARVRLRHGDGGEVVNGVPGHTFRDGRFVIRGVLPGEYSIDVQLAHGSTRPSLKVEGIKVREGIPYRGERLQIEVEKHVRLVRIHLQDSAGAPVFGAEVRVHHAFAKGSGVWACRSDAEGVCDVLLAPSGNRVSVHHAKFRIRELQDVRKSLRVVLERARPVRLTIAGMPQLPKYLYYQARVVRPGVGTSRDDRTGRRLKEKHVVFVDEPGDYQLVLTPYRVGSKRQSLEVLTRGRMRLTFHVGDWADAIEAMSDVEIRLESQAVALVRRLLESEKRSIR
jgi:hypothetical protein